MLAAPLTASDSSVLSMLLWLLGGGVFVVSAIAASARWFMGVEARRNAIQ
jgi:hypothetical protein